MHISVASALTTETPIERSLPESVSYQSNEQLLFTHYRTIKHSVYTPRRWRCRQLNLARDNEKENQQKQLWTRPTFALQIYVTILKSDDKNYGGKLFAYYIVRPEFWRS